MATSSKAYIVFLLGVLSSTCESKRVDVVADRRAVLEAPEDFDPWERLFGPDVTSIKAQWNTGVPEAFPDSIGRSETRNGRSVSVMFKVGNWKDLKNAGPGECLRKCKVRTETSGVFGTSCNGGFNWKKLNPTRVEKHAVSVVMHNPRAGGRAMPWADRYTLCCQVVACEPDTWKVNYEIFSPMLDIRNDAITKPRYAGTCLCCTEAMQKDKQGFHHLSRVNEICKLSFKIRTSLSSVDGISGYIPDSDVELTVGVNNWEKRCVNLCREDKTHKFGHPMSQLAIASWL